MRVNKNNKEEHVNKSLWPIFGFCHEKDFVFLIMNSSSKIIMSSKISPVLIQYKKISSSCCCNHHRRGLMESGIGSTGRLETKSGGRSAALASRELWVRLVHSPQFLGLNAGMKFGGGYQLKIAINSKF